MILQDFFLLDIILSLYLTFLSPRKIYFLLLVILLTCLVFPKFSFTLQPFINTNSKVYFQCYLKNIVSHPIEIMIFVLVEDTLHD